mmetsp:Transcript_67471/g.149487  ORF Transcript_67471/g.149487 Transcript_67471/m.149487 type:complete len:262 (+) Transcript_67471:90-875(+)
MGFPDPGMGGPGVMPVPAQIMRYKGPLVLLTAGYAAVLITALVVGAVSNVLNDFFVLLAAALMAFNPQQCMGQCVLPFALFAVMAALFDVITVIQMLTEGRSINHPGSSDLFSSYCLYSVPAMISGNTTVYTEPDHTAYMLPDGTKVAFPRQLCSLQWVIGNVVVLASCALDIAASFLGCRILKAARELLPGDGADPLGGGQGLLAGAAPGGGGPGGGIPPGGGGPGGGGSGGGPAGPRQQQQQQPPGFTHFQGPGQRLGG